MRRASEIVGILGRGIDQIKHTLGTYPALPLSRDPAVHTCGHTAGRTLVAAIAILTILRATAVTLLDAISAVLLITTLALRRHPTDPVILCAALTFPQTCTTSSIITRDAWLIAAGPTVVVICRITAGRAVSDLTTDLFTFVTFGMVAAPAAIVINLVTVEAL